jgi:hypothetical protein
LRTENIYCRNYDLPLLVTTLACTAVGVSIPYVGPLARLLGFRALPLSFLAVLVGMIVTYLALAEAGKPSSSSRAAVARWPGRSPARSDGSCVAQRAGTFPGAPTR